MPKPPSGPTQGALAADSPVRALVALIADLMDPAQVKTLLRGRFTDVSRQMNYDGSTAQVAGQLVDEFARIRPDFSELLQALLEERPHREADIERVALALAAANTQSGSSGADLSHGQGDWYGFVDGLATHNLGPETQGLPSDPAHHCVLALPFHRELERPEALAKWVRQGGRLLAFGHYCPPHHLTTPGRWTTALGFRFADTLLRPPSCPKTQWRAQRRLPDPACLVTAEVSPGHALLTGVDAAQLYSPGHLELLTDATVLLTAPADTVVLLPKGEVSAHGYMPNIDRFEPSATAGPLVLAAVWKHGRGAVCAVASWTMVKVDHPGNQAFLANCGEWLADAAT